MTRHVTVLSGGLDSTVTLARMLHEDRAALSSPPPLALSFDYGQTHYVELKAASRVAKFYGVEHEIVDVRGLLEGGALLGKGEIPEGHYADESMKSTVVHARNLLFASIAISRAGEGGEVWLGVHGGDHHIYPDCRPTFWTPFAAATREAYGVRIRTPYLTSDKTQIVREGAELGAPMDFTWSCYRGGERQCGRCGTCVERIEAFELAGVIDAAPFAHD